MPAILPAIAGFFSTGIGEAVGGALAGSAVSFGLSKLAGGAPNIHIPPPPGAAMIDPAGAEAAADQRRRAAAAGGLQSTIGAGAQPAAAGANSATSGSKSLMGQ